MDVHNDTPDMTSTPHDISSIGEFGLIRRIAGILGQTYDSGEDLPPPGSGDTLLRGISDDAAAFRPTPGKIQLLTTDMFVEGIHFDLTFTSPGHLGWKVMTANISDIAAMGGLPAFATVAISLPAKITVPMVEEFYEGIARSTRRFGYRVVGGDTTAASGNMTVSVAMTGETDEGKLLTRRGAVPGDYLCVSGHLGASFAGLRVLQREKARYLSSPGDRAGFSPNLEPYKAALEKHLMPAPRLDLVPLLTDRVRVNAMIDISDSLASEVHHICEQSGTGAAVYERNLPLDGVTQQIASEFSESPTSYALHGGEEFELLFTLSDGEYEKLEAMTADVTVIGRIQEKEKGIICVREQGESAPLPRTGWDHFPGGDAEPAGPFESPRP